MASRMDRYTEKPDVEVENNTFKRTRRNANLYRSLYDEANYSNIEKVETLDKTNVVDVEKVKELLSKNSNYEKRRSIDEDVEIVDTNDDSEDKSYDIKDILSKAKEDEVKDAKKRSIDNLKYEYERKNKEPKDEQEEVEEIIHTIFTNSLDADDSDLLKDLKSNTMISSNDEINDAIKKEDVEDNNKEVIDNSFFTTSLKLNKKDFLDDNEEEKKSNNVLIKISIALLVVCFIALLVYIFYFMK